VDHHTLSSSRSQRLHRLRGWGEAEVRDLYPGSFAFVMATGIVSTACQQLGWQSLANALFALAAVGYGLVWLGMLARVVRYPRRVLADLTSHRRGPGFLTSIAATGVLGMQVSASQGALACALWLLSVALWLGLTYAFFTAVAIRERKPDLESGLSGCWLLVVVATQSVAMLGARVAPLFGATGPVVFFVALGLYLCGCLLYLVLIGLVVYRVDFFRLTPAEFTPDYWINMGAIAISAVAGTTLMGAVDRWWLLQQLLPFLQGMTLLFWAGATWWIPLLVVLEGWRHLSRHFPLVYGPQYWTLVFPLGMYTAGTFELAQAFGLHFLLEIPDVLLPVVLAIWLLLFAGLLQRLIGELWAVDHRPPSVAHASGRL
jgi:tellurite resistance protein TehA-like permease